MPLYITIRFYEELNDFLPAEKRKRRFGTEIQPRQSVKDFVQSLGVPHTEIDLILINGNSVDFDYILKEGDDVSIYPVFESLDISDVQHLRPEPLREPKFVLDVHLGKLAKLMRLFGFDTHYEKHYDDEEIIRISVAEHRTILTRDLGILKRNIVTHGYYVRSTRAEEQITEIIKRFNLQNEIREFSRCLLCNSSLEPISKKEVEEVLPPKVKKFYNEFFICQNCRKVYWRGSHYKKMLMFVEEVKSKVQ